MTQITLLTRCLGLTLVTVAFTNAATVTCRGDGKTDVTACLQATLQAAQQQGDSQLFFPKGRFLVSNGLVALDRIKWFGVGPGDGIVEGTAIVASDSFPLHGVVVQMGSNSASFGVQISNLTIDGGGRADIDLKNVTSMEQSYATDLELSGFLKAGIDIETAGAQNSGPFTHLDIHPGSSVPVTSDTGCVIVRNVISFRGMTDVTCDGGTGYLSRPNVAFQLDGEGLYSGLQAAHFTTGAILGSDATSADGLTLMNSNFGSDVSTGVVINSETPSQNLSLMSISCASCMTTLDDMVTGKTSTASIGWYFLGNGNGPYKKVIASDQNIQDQLGNYTNW